MTIALIFVTLLGACIGSFLNVVVYRLPMGQSLSKPPSSCPKCSHRLAWYDNIPVLGWIKLRGRCRYCKTAISVQYPLVEAVTALIFGGWFFICYMTDVRPQFAGPGLEPTGLIFLAYLFLWSVLIASTLIDAKYFVIPEILPWIAAGAGLLLIPIAVLAFPNQAVTQVELPETTTAGLLMERQERIAQIRPPAYQQAAEVRVAVLFGRTEPVEISAAPLTSNRGAAMGFGGLVGLAISILLVRRKIIPRSFDEQQLGEAVGGDSNTASTVGSTDPHDWIQYPHARREVMKEALFLALPILGAVIGGWWASRVAEPWDPIWRVLGGIALGFLGGGAVVWIVRILGTLGFGKEAMGLGDVFLMAGVGAVTGWQIAVLAFFIAPFFGLVWAAGSLGVGVILKKRFQPIPYGPHLAVATLVAAIAREPMIQYFGALL